jgi:hypothetical protein|tara:strand:+ start:82 stop:288 length:207 start_codon:yes stop_codon:yes gene_type:complete
MSWKSIIKQDWKDTARGDLDADESLIAFQQSLFYMEKVLEELKKPNPNIPQLIEFIEYNIQTIKEELK